MRCAPMLSVAAAALLLSGCASLSTLWPAQSDGGQAATVAVSKAAPDTATGRISVQWRNNVDQRKPASPPGFSLPAEIETAHGRVIIVGGQDRRLRIYSPDGRELDRIAMAHAGESGVLRLSNGLVVVGDVGGVLYGIDPNSRRVVWRKQLTAGLTGRPVAAGDDFIVQLSNNQVYRFHANGDKVWSFSGLLGGLGIHLTPSPVVYQGRVYTVLSNGDVIALNVENGNFVWKRQLLLSNKAAVMSEVKIPAATPLVIPAGQSGRGEAMLLVSIYQGDLTFLSLQDGSTLNTRKISLKSQPLLIDDVVYIADAAGAVSALSTATAATLWKKQLSDGGLTGPALWQGNLWVADDHGRVFRLDRNGRVQAGKQLAGRIDRAPVASADGVLVRNSLGTLYLLR